MKAYQAYAAGGFRVTAETAKRAAKLFFDTYPNKRKCNVVQGEVDGRFFIVSYGRDSEGKCPASFKNVSKKSMDSLPE